MSYNTQKHCETKEYVHSFKMQVGATLPYYLGAPVTRRYMHSPEMQIGADTLTLNLDLLNPKSAGCGAVSGTTIVPSFKSFYQG